MREFFEYVTQGIVSSRNNISRHKVRFWKANKWQKSILYIDPKVWNKLSDSMKRDVTLNTSKHDVN